MPNKALNHYRRCCNLLEGIYPRTEAQSIARLLVEKITGLSFHNILTSSNVSLSVEQIEILNQYLSLLKLQKPIQYILGETHFFDLTFRVTPDVLIPRPETEELVHWILQSNDRSMKKVLDIGTGSGCIAISLSKNRPSWEVFATDISVKALEVATENAKQIGAKVFFKNHDILSKEINFGPFDIIVSNPPYVRVSEKKLMQRNVLDNEPGIALFVADDYPLVFYAAIAECAKDSLVQNGAIYCEINEALCNDTVAVFQNVGFFNVEVRKDIHGKDRMICAKRE